MLAGIDLSRLTKNLVISGAREAVCAVRCSVHGGIQAPRWTEIDAGRVICTPEASKTYVQWRFFDSSFNLKQM